MSLILYLPVYTYRGWSVINGATDYIYVKDVNRIIIILKIIILTGRMNILNNFKSE